MIRLFDMTLRDGLQSLARCYTPSQRFQMLTTLSRYYPRYPHIPYIEIGSTVSPKLLPQMSGTPELFKMVKDIPQTAKYGLLCTSSHHLDQIFKMDPSGVGLVMSVSEDFAKKNLRSTYEQSLRDVVYSIQTLHENYSSHHLFPYIRVYLSCVFGCKFEKIDIKRIIDTVKAIQDVYRNLNLHNYNADIVLCDTYGIANSRVVDEVLRNLQQADLLYPPREYYNLASVPKEDYLAVHLHSTRKTFQQMVDVALGYGIRKWDVAVGGIGGCPYADKSLGNLDMSEFVRYVQRQYPELISTNVVGQDILKAEREFEKLLI